MVCGNDGHFGHQQISHHGQEHRDIVGQHPLVIIAKKAFGQLKLPIPRYHGTYNISIILRFIESLGKNKTLTLKQLSEKTAFLVVFLTLSRYCLDLTLDQIFLPNFFILNLLIVFFNFWNFAGIFLKFDFCFLKISKLYFQSQFPILEVLFYNFFFI